jgi:hypothetical protein
MFMAIKLIVGKDSYQDLVDAATYKEMAHVKFIKMLQLFGMIKLGSYVVGEMIVLCENMSSMEESKACIVFCSGQGLDATMVRFVS